jgi:radical SAM superfamily enzyme
VATRREHYVRIVCNFLERLPPQMVIHRLSGDAPPDYLIAPLWCLDKPALLRAIREELVRRDSRQGKHFQPRSSAAARWPLELC